MIMCSAAPLSHELNQQLCEMFPTAHIGQAYGTQPFHLGGSFLVINPRRNDGNVHRYNVAYLDETWKIRQCVPFLFGFYRCRSLLKGSGVLLPGTIARIVKPDGSLAGYDEAGELVIKTPSVALGYSNNAQA